MSDSEDDRMSEGSQEEDFSLGNSDVVTKYKAAAEIANKSLGGIIQYCSAGKRTVDVCAFGDTIIDQQCQQIYKKNKKMNKGVAFPTCLSVNDCVCHYSPLSTETTLLAPGDVVKVDLGVHVDGLVAVVAHTFVIPDPSNPERATGPVADVILAAHKAAEAAVKTIKAGVTNQNVTEVVKKVADCYGVNPVQGVLMHQMKRYIIDGNNAVIGREEADQRVEDFQFEDAQVYTVDVVMSTGSGKPIQRDARTTVFKRAVDQSYRLKMKASRYVFNEVNRRFDTFPFTVRSMDEKQGRLGVVECVKHALLHPYPVLFEKPGDIVAHFKYTVLLLPSGTVKATGLPVPEYVSDKQVSEEIAAVLATSSKTKKKRKKKKKKKKAAASTMDES